MMCIILSMPPPSSSLANFSYGLLVLPESLQRENRSPFRWPRPIRSARCS